MKFLLAALLFLASLGVSHAACIFPNPNLSGPPFTDGCPLPAAGLNLLAPALNPAFTGPNVNFTTTFSTTAGTALAGPIHMTNTDTGTNMTGTAKLSALTVDDSFGGGGSGEGNRNAIFAHLNQTGSTPFTNGNYHFHTGVFSWMDVGGSDASTGGQYFAFGGLTETTPGHNITASQMKGAEFDTSIKTGSTAGYMATLSLVLVNSHAVRGTVFDAALAIEKDATSAQTYKTGISFGSNFSTWPLGSDSTMIGAWSAAGSASAGVDFSNVTFGGCAFASKLICVRDISGTVELKSNFPAISFSDTQIATPFTHGGLVRFLPDGATNDTYKYQINTAAGGDFSTIITSFSINSGGTFTTLQPLVVNGTLVQNQITPATSSAACVQGAIAWDATYVYLCTGTNTWKRVATATW